jgi:hypothetical protein
MRTNRCCKKTVDCTETLLLFFKEILIPDQAIKSSYLVWCKGFCMTVFLDSFFFRKRQIDLAVAALVLGGLWFSYVQNTSKI